MSDNSPMLSGGDVDNAPMIAKEGAPRLLDDCIRLWYEDVLMWEVSIKCARFMVRGVSFSASAYRRLPFVYNHEVEITWAITVVPDSLISPPCSYATSTAYGAFEITIKVPQAWHIEVISGGQRKIYESNPYT